MRHQDLLLNHILESYTFADAAARNLAGSYVSADLGRIGYQQDTKQYYRLLTTTPTWMLIAPVTPSGVGFASLQTASATPSGILGMTSKMMGLGAVITPLSTGKLLVHLTIGAFYTSGGNYFTQANVRYGTSTPPVNGAAVTGTQIGPQMTGPANTVIAPMTIVALVTLVPGTAYWFDLTIASSNAAATGHTDASCFSIVELP